MDNEKRPVKVEEDPVFHKEYRLFKNGQITTFDSGAIQRICLDFSSDSSSTDVQIDFANAETFRWNTKWLSSYTIQFGVAASFDGRYLFAQTWKNGLLCLDAQTGEIIWRTKSKRGITSVFVSDHTVLCHLREHSLQLLDIHTGELLAEKTPATAWKFTALDHEHIICQVTAKRWELIDAQTLETRKVFSHKAFTGGHTDYCISKIVRTPDGRIKVSGFKNVWDDSVSPPIMLPNLEFEHYNA